MNPDPRMIRLAAAFLLLSVAAARVSAQQLLYAENDGKLCLVRAAHGIVPCIEENGKIVPVKTRGFLLQDTQEFLPAFVTVRDLNVHTSYATLNGRGSINNTFYLDAEFETDYHLKNVFVVLNLKTELTGKAIFVDEIGELQPHMPRGVHLQIPLNEALGPGGYGLHIFSDGLEVLQSQIPFDIREAVLDRMVAKRVSTLPDGSPKYLLGPMPEYPKALKKAGTRGEVVVTLRIGTNGAVYNPSVVSATNPAFADSALIAVRQWRFLPEMRDGRPVEMWVNLPLEFGPSPGGKSKS
jgi:TonB family protein